MFSLELSPREVFSLPPKDSSEFPGPNDIFKFVRMRETGRPSFEKTGKTAQFCNNAFSHFEACHILRLKGSNEN